MHFHIYTHNSEVEKKYTQKHANEDKSFAQTSRYLHLFAWNGCSIAKKSLTSTNLLQIFSNTLYLAHI